MAAGNPAHNLERILRKFEANASGQTTVIDCWNETLDHPKDFAASIAGAAALIPAIRQKVISHGLDEQLRLVDRYEDEWLRPFFPSDRSWTSHTQDVIDPDSLLALSSLSAIFSALEGVPSVLGPEESTTLLGLLDEARAAARAADDLPAALRGAVLARLQDVQWAVEHYNISGPEGLQAALDRLGVELAKTARRSGEWRKKAGTALLFGWLLFSNADEVVADLEASTTIVQEIVTWTDDARALRAPALPELGPGNSKAEEPPALAAAGETCDQDDSDEDEDVWDAEIVEKGE
jgi:hypothetical protein